jgi:hypothetical protein
MRYHGDIYGLRSVNRGVSCIISEPGTVWLHQSARTPSETFSLVSTHLQLSLCFLEKQSVSTLDSLHTQKYPLPAEQRAFALDEPSTTVMTQPCTVMTRSIYTTRNTQPA